MSRTIRFDFFLEQSTYSMQAFVVLSVNKNLYTTQCHQSPCIGRALSVQIYHTEIVAETAFQSKREESTLKQYANVFRFQRGGSLRWDTIFSFRGVTVFSYCQALFSSYFGPFRILLFCIFHLLFLKVQRWQHK